MRLFGCLTAFLLCGQLDAAAVSNPGLVACYSFSGNADDGSGNQHHGTIFGAVPVSDRFGVPGSAFEFNGTDDYINIGLLSDITSSNEFSISVWIRPDQVKMQSILFMMPDNLSDRLNAMAYYDHNGVASTVWDFGNCLSGGRLIQPSPSFSNTWQHWVYTVHPANGMKVYVNGVLAHSTSSSSSVIDRNRKLWIGGGEDASGAQFYFDGAIDDLQLYETELDYSQVYQVYLTETACSSVTGIQTPHSPRFFFDSSTNTLFFPEGMIFGNANLTLMNLLGQHVYREVIRKGTTDIRLPEDYWLNGMMFFILVSDDGRKLNYGRFLPLVK